MTTFDTLFKKHFPMAHQMYSIVAGHNGFEKFTLTLVRGYDGSYELEDSLMGAFIMHVKLGNITGWNLSELLKKFHWSDEFDYDINYRLQTLEKYNKNQKTEKESLGFEYESDIGTYDFDDSGRVEIGGGYNIQGYNRDGYDVDGLDEWGYAEE